MRACESGLHDLRLSSRRQGRPRHQADAEIDEATFLHPLIQGILLLECSNLSPAESAAVLAPSGTTTKEGGSIGNSHLYVDLAASFIAQWDDEALMRRDKTPTETYASHCRCGDNDVGSLFSGMRVFFFSFVCIFVLCIAQKIERRACTTF